MSNRGRHRKSNKHLIVQILGKTIANRMMECQKEQEKIPNLDVFLHRPFAGTIDGGFVWNNTTEGWDYWSDRAEEIKNHPLYKKYINDRR